MSAQSKSSLAETLKQTQPFRNAAQEAYLSVVRTAAELSYSFDLLLRPFGITQPQYNVLRILNGAGEEGLGRNEIRSRMVNAMPDMSRLLDRMEKAEWIKRTQSEEDRRHFPTVITRAGKAMLTKIDRPLMELHAAQFQNVGEAQLKRLLALMEEVRKNLA